MYFNKLSVMISEEQLKARVAELGKQITEDYKDKDNVMIVGILKGSFVFMADLIRAIDLPVTVDFMIASSYGHGTTSDGIVSVKKDIALDLTGKNIIVVEDILDTGYTLQKIQQLLSGRNAESVKICTLLDKPARHAVDIKVDYFGFTIENQFIVGYGLDLDEEYRNLPFIGLMKE